MPADVGSSDAGVEGFRFREMVPAGLFFLSATVLYTYPFVFHLPSAVMIGGGDYLGEASLVAWNAHQLLQNPTGLLDTQFFYPHSGSTAYGQSLFFPGLVAAPALALTPRPLLVTNALMLLALVLSGLFMYMLARSLAAGVFPSLLAGVVFAFFPNRMDHLGQFTVQMGLFLPLAVWAFYRVLFWRRWVDLFLLIGAIWAQTLSSMYYTFALGFLLAGLFVACVCLRPRLLSRALLLKGTVGCLLLIAALAPFLKPYVDLHRELGLQRDVGQAEWFGMDLLSILDPGVFNKLYGGRLLSLGRSEGGLFPGFVILILVGLAIGSLCGNQSSDAPAWTRSARRVLLASLALCLLAIVVIPSTGGLSLHVGSVRLLSAHNLTLAVNVLPALALAWIVTERRPGREGPLTVAEWIPVLAFLMILTYLLTLSPTLRILDRPWGTAPFRWIFFHVPGGSAFRAPGRWSLVFVVPLALLAAFGAQAASRLRRIRFAAWLPAALLIAVMVEYVDAPLTWAHLSEPPPVYGWLADQPGDFALLELPTHAGNADAFYMFWGTRHWKRLVNGAVGFVPATVNEIVLA